MKTLYNNLYVGIICGVVLFSCKESGLEYPGNLTPEENTPSNNIHYEELKITEADGFPKLFFSVDEFVRIDERTKMSGWYADLYKSMLNDAKLYLNNEDYSMVPFLISKKGAYSTLTCGRELGTCLMNLAFCGYVEKNAVYIKKAVEVLMASSDAMIGDSYGFNSISGDPITKAIEDNKLGIPVKWMSHLQAGDGAYAWALGYDLLYPYMTDEQRKQVKQDLLDLADWLYTSKAYAKQDYATSACNHSSVHYGPLGMIALLFPDDQRASMWLDRAKERTSAYVACSADLDGYILEGHTYQGYGIHGAYPFIHALKRIEGTDMTKEMYENLNITGSKKDGIYFDQKRKNAYPTMFENHGWQNVWKILPNGHMITMNDSRDVWPGDAAVFGALLSNNGVQLQAWLQSIGYKNGVIPSSGRGNVGNRFLLFVLGDEPVEPEIITKENAGLSKKFESGRVFARSGWGDPDDALLSFTSGYDAHPAHNHLDENNVTFCVNGTEALYDPPYEANLTQHHSLVQVKDENGTEILIDEDKKEGQIDSYMDDGDIVYVTGDAKYAYNNKLAKAKRSLAFVRESPSGPYILFRDDMQLKDNKKGSFSPQYITHPDNKIVEKDNGVLVTGPVAGGKVFITAYNGTTPIKLKEHYFASDETYTRPNKVPFKILDYYRLIEASEDIENVNNCIITTLVIPYDNETSLPEITVSKEGNKIKWKLQYNDGTVHNFDISEDKVSKI